MDGPIEILHVDDDPELADLTAMLLEREDDRFAVETEPNASDGLERLEEGAYDCVVSDYDMPGRDGIEFLERVQEIYSDVPFILFTGKGSEEIASEAISAGVTDYLQKEGGTDQYTILANRIANAVERTRAQRERRRHLGAIETAREGISILDEEGVFTYVNQAYAELYGYDVEELLGKHWERLYPEGDRQRIREEVLPTVEAEGFWHGETTGLRADGSTFIEDHTLATTANGELVCTVRDISNRKEQRRRFEAIFNNTYTFIGLARPDGTILEANRTALSFAELDREEVVGELIWETPWFSATETASQAAREAVEQARGGELYREEIPVQGADREVIIDFTMRPVTNEKGEVTLLVPEGRDITALNEYVRRLETLIGNLPGMVYRCRNEPGWPMEHLRGEVEALTGYSRAELESRGGIYGSEVIHPADRKSVRAAVEAALANRERFEFTYRIVTKDDTTRRVWERGRGVYSDDGELEALEGFITDLIDRDVEAV